LSSYPGSILRENEAIVMDRLKGKAALITGGASGIGFATAKLFLEEGAKVAIADISEKSGKAAVKKLQKKGREVIFIKADVSKNADAKMMVRKTVDSFGRLDVLFNNAGILITKPVDKLSEAEWDRVIGINLKGVFLVSKYAISQMLKQREGVIVNNASANAIVADLDVPSYCASKGGVAMLTRAMALDYAKKHIRVNAVCYGEIHTPLAEQEARDRGEDWDKFSALMASQHPIGRMGTPEEAARAVLFLASDDSTFVTGALLSVDGGFTAA
jgi:NAD(P)-dependent dehydrogenase (short-subunit alcohol dehydrogenase family)